MGRHSIKPLFILLCKLYARGQNFANLKYISLDGTLIPSYSFKDTTGYSGKHHRTGVKISNLVDRQGVPFAFQFARGNVNDVKLAEATMRSFPLRVSALTYPILLADRGYDSFPFRKFLRERGIDPNIQRRVITKEREGFAHCYRFDEPLGRKRFVVERFHAWMKSNRRLRMRYDYSLLSFKAFVYLSAIVICVRQLVA